MKARKGDGQGVFVVPTSPFVIFNWDALYDVLTSKTKPGTVEMYRASHKVRSMTTGNYIDKSLFYISGPGFCIQLELNIFRSNTVHDKPSTAFLPTSQRDLSTEEEAIEVDKAIAVIWDKSMFEAHCTSAQTIFND